MGLLDGVRSLIKLYRQPVIDHLDELVVMLPVVGGAAAVVAKVIKEADQAKREELSKLKEAVEKNTDKQDEAISILKNMATNDSAIKTALENATKECAKEALEKEKEAEKSVAFPTALFISFSDSLTETEKVKKETGLAFSGIDPDNLNPGREKDALIVINQFIDAYLGGDCSEMTEDGYKIFEITQEGLSFNYSCSPEDYDGIEDIPQIDKAYYDKLLFALNAICAPADMSDSEIKGKYFDEYYLYGMNSEELENWFG